MKQPEISDQLVTVNDVLRFGVSQFNRHALYFGHGTDNAYDDVLLLIQHCLAIPADLLPEFYQARLLASEKASLLALFQKRIDERIPVPYLIKQAWFCGLSFYVDERVLIPRSPIAELIKSRFKPYYQGNPTPRILDLCTGSGCIGIACAYAFPDSNVVLSDISEAALSVAKKNSSRHKVEDRVRTLASNLFDDIEGEFDIIVTNPPYVDREDFHDMPEEYQHEPAMALASGEWGLDHPLQILEKAATRLTQEGILVMEVGNSGMHLMQMYPDIDFNWVPLEYGGQGVLVLSRFELEQYAPQFACLKRQ